MGATGASLTKHPDREEINERLLSGESLEDVLKWLKRKYSYIENPKRRKRLCPNIMTLQAYRKNFLDCEGEVLREIKKERRQRLSEERKRRALERVQASESYQVAKAEYADKYVKHISHTEQCLQDIYLKVSERIAIMESQPTKHLNDKVIVEQLNLMRNILRDYFEMQQALKSETETNISIDLQRVAEEVKIIKAAIRETIIELCPEILPAFLEKLKEKLSTAKADLEASESDAGSININIRG